VRARAIRRLVLPATVALALSACGHSDGGSNVDPSQVDAVAAPDVGACRLLTPEDADQPTNATRVVDCQERHTAETFAAGDLPDDLQGES